MRPLLILTAAILAAVMPAAGQTRQPASAGVLVAAGGYELSAEDGSRKCLMLLRPSTVPGGHGVGFPAPCRSAFPILASVSAWTVSTGDDAPRLRLRLLNAAGAVLVDFREAAPDGRARGRDAGQTVYLIRPTAGASLDQRAASLAGAATTPSPASSFVPPPAESEAMRRASGTYALMRSGGKDTGCRFTLAGGAAQQGNVEASPGCADKGVVFFGVRQWSINGGTLWLTGAKGRLSFERNRKGDWDKAPGQGEPLTLAPVRP